MMNVSSGKATILIVDDERLIINVLVEMLSDKYNCSTADSAEEAIEMIESTQFNLVLSDIEMGGMNGIQLIPHILKLSPDTVVIMISGKQTFESAIEAMRVGAFDYIQKPFNIDHVEIAIERAFEHHRLLAGKRLYEQHLEELVKQRTDQLDYLKYHDALTDLPNRVLFEDRLSQSLDLAQTDQRILAVVLFSLDRFKNIHNTLGQSVAVRILCEIAERLKKSLNKSGTTARFEGEEFALLITQIPNSALLIKVINDIKETISSSIIAEEQEIFVTASIGISLFPEDGNDCQTLLKNAGAALARVREQGGNNYQFYTNDMNAKALQRLEMENKLRRALERQEFEIYYQPKIHTTSEKIIGMEALIRWHHPELGLVSPLEFIPLLEENGLIIPIGEWILHDACAQSKIWADQGFNLCVSVNLSTRQFQQPDLAEMIIRTLKETGFDPHCLELEVTESSIMENAQYAVEVLNRLKAVGIKISIDDFGTGYSSLGYLKNLPIDILKIDRSFVRDVTSNADDAALVMAIISLSHDLRLKVTAEGVETKEQLKFLHLQQCDFWQGFLSSRPITADAFEKLLMSND